MRCSPHRSSQFTHTHQRDSALAEYERELVIERTALKRQASRANGTKFGRPRKVASGEHIATAKRMKADGHTGKDIAKYLGVSRATVYRYLAEFHIGGRTCHP